MKYLWSAVVAFMVLIGTVPPVRAEGPADAPPLVRVLEVFRELDLSGVQKQQIAAILKGKRELLRTQVDELIAARRELNESIRRAAGYDEAVERSHARVTAAERSVIRTKAELLREIRPILTAEQLAVVASAREEVASRFGSRLSRIRSLVDWWVDRQLES